MPRIARLLAAVAMLPLAGCASGGAWRRDGGQASRDDALRASLAGASFGSAYASLDTREGAPRDQLLAQLYRGILGYYAGRLDESASAFERAQAMVDNRLTKSLSCGAASVVVSDDVLPYVLGATERLFVPYYAALGWLARGEVGEAAVEARRLGALLGRADGEQSQASADVRAAMHYFAGAVFEAAGERADAVVSYRNAVALHSASVLLADSLGPRADSGDVVVVLERGFVDYPVEKSVMAWLANGELVALTTGSDDVRWRTAERVSHRLSRSHGTELHPAGATAFFSMSWPEFSGSPPDGSRMTVRTDGGDEVAPTIDAEVSSAVRADFERGQAERIARAMVRAAARFAALKAAEKQIEDSKDQKGRKKTTSIALGVGLAAFSIADAVLDRADTRSWPLLPSSLGVARVRLAPGEQEVKVVSGNELLTVGRMTVRPGTVTVIAYRAWPLSGRPVVQVAGVQ